MSQSATTIYKKISSLEQQVQQMKVQAYFNLPKKQQTISLYPQNELNRAVKSTRNRIWAQKYAKKIKGLS